jgi:hypothetical protein
MDRGSYRRVYSIRLFYNDAASSDESVDCSISSDRLTGSYAGIVVLKPRKRQCAVMHTSGRVEHEASRGSSGSAAPSRVESSGVEWRRKRWHNGK